MKTDKKRQTITDELLIDIYANPILKALLILIDRPFASTLTGLELDQAQGRLLFVFDDHKRDLGDVLNPQLLDYFRDREHIEICHMDLETRTPVSAFKVPLSLQ